MPTPQEWFDRKLSQRLWKVRAPARIVEEWEKFTGRRHYAKVTLAASAADSFGFESRGAWLSTEDRSAYEPFVLDGILDELMQGPAEPVLGVRFVLEETVVQSDSNGWSFYQAARRATQKILAGRGTDHDNCYLVDG